MIAVFPPPIDDLLQEFADAPDWDDRYELIIDLGRKLPPIDEQYRTDANRVRGCMSTVWMVARPHRNGQPRLELIADSDSQIVKGLIVILLSLFSGRPLNDIVQSDADEVFRRLGLAQHLSPNRRNGLYAMVQRIRTLAVEQLAQSNPAKAGDVDR